VALCFGVPKAIVEGWRLQFGAGFLSEFEGCNLELSFLESKVEHLQPQAETLAFLQNHIGFRCGESFDVAKATFSRLEGCNLELVSCRLIKRRYAEAAARRTPGLARPSVAWCFAVAKATFWRLKMVQFGAAFFQVQKAMLGRK
jgi:hypothetical protein